MGRLAIDVAGSCKAWEVVDVFLDSFRRHVISRHQRLKSEASNHKRQSSNVRKKDLLINGEE